MAQDPVKTTEEKGGFDPRAMLDALQKTFKNRRDEEQHQFGMEMDLAKAAKDGIVLPQQQDPKQLNIPSPPEGLERNIIEALGSQDRDFVNRDDLLSKALTDTLTRDIPKALEEFRTQRSLQFAPAGKFGQKLGSILNLIPGLELGTTVFGGLPSKAQEVEALAGVLYKVSPLVRTELGDIQRQEFGTGRTAKSMGMLGTSQFVGTPQQEMKAVATYTQILNELGLSSELPRFGETNLFNPDSPVDITGAINAYSQSIASIAQLSEPGSEPRNQREANIKKELANRGIKAAEQFREVIKDYIDNGGSKETLKETIRKAQKYIIENYIQDKNADESVVVAANDLIRNLTGFLNQADPMFIGAEERQAEKKQKKLVEEFGEPVPLEKVISQKGTQLLEDPKIAREKQRKFIESLLKQLQGKK